MKKIVIKRACEEKNSELLTYQSEFHAVFIGTNKAILSVKFSIIFINDGKEYVFIALTDRIIMAVICY